MLSREERARFEEQGFVRLPGAVDAAAAAALGERVLAFLRSRGRLPDAPPSGFTVHAAASAPLAKTLGFEAVWGARVREAIDELLGREAWRMPPYAGQVLAICFPTAAEWQLPHKGWHLDYQAPAGRRGLPGVQVFLCLDRLEPRGGATLVAAGLHRLVASLRARQEPDWPGRSAQVRVALEREIPWLRELLSLRPGEDRAARFLERGTPEGDTTLRVAELTGEPGDVLAVHPWLLHSASPNCGARPRLVLSERVRSAP